MSIVVDTEAAKLVNLTIDTLKKVRDGQITMEQWARFINLSPEDREARFSYVKKTKFAGGISGPFCPFTLLLDLGVLTVSNFYDHTTALEWFIRQNRKKFYSYNHEITDQNFSDPSLILKPGDKLWIRAFQQIVRTTTSEQRMAFLAKQKAVYPGAQGLSFVWDQKRDQLLKGKSYASYDKPERLWVDNEGDYRVPTLYNDSAAGFSFGLSSFKGDRRIDEAFLCFTKVA